MEVGGDLWFCYSFLVLTFFRLFYNMVLVLLAVPLFLFCCVFNFLYFQLFHFTVYFVVGCYCQGVFVPLSKLTFCVSNLV